MKMFRPIRRKTKEIDEEAAKELLRKERIGILAVNGDDQYPYAIPVNFRYDEEKNRIYFHGAGAGHKYDSLKVCDKVCFTVCGKEVVRDLAWAPYVKSAVVFGRCRLQEKNEESMDQLRKLAAKYFPNEELIEEEMQKAGRAAQMYEIEIEHLSGKEIQER